MDTVSFSGPTKQGRWIASICGAELKPARLELGGQSAAIVLDDADLDQARAALGLLIFGNSGQTCFAMSRVLVPEQRTTTSWTRWPRRRRSCVLGDPLSEDTTMGPLASARRRSDVESRVRASVADGARIASGGRRPASPVRGYFYEPTVLTDVTPAMPIARDEICGPVASVISYRDEAEAVAFANDGFGLAATVWTSDPQRGLDIAQADPGRHVRHQPVRAGHRLALGRPRVERPGHRLRPGGPGRLPDVQVSLPAVPRGTA